jgi:hypothetical protein
MRFRKLRIAWSVEWGLATVLLIVLWARSYWRNDEIHSSHPTEFYNFRFTNGILHAVHGIDDMPISNWMCFSYYSREPEPPQLYNGFTEGGGWQLNIPFWLILAFTSAIGAIPWIISPKRFSLRSFLALASLIAILMGLVAVAFRK